MKAQITSLDDGTVTIVIEAEGALEMHLLRVFYAQTYAKDTPARVLKLGALSAQFIPLAEPCEVPCGDSYCGEAGGRCKRGVPR